MIPVTIRNVAPLRHGMRADRLSLARLVLWGGVIALGVIAAGTLWGPVVSTQRRGMVATFLTVHTDLALTVCRFYSPFTAERSVAVHSLPIQ